MEEVINYGWLSLIPAVVAVVLAFATRNVVLSLAISLFLGIMIQVGANPWLSLQHLFSDYLFVDLATDNNPQTIVMMATVGGFVALIEKSGGAGICKGRGKQRQQQSKSAVGGLAGRAGHLLFRLWQQPHSGAHVPPHL